MNIYWSQFSWEAFATLVVGLAAVVAAWWVGQNQIKIQRRQLRLIENDLKIQLLEKRISCVNDMRELHFAYQQHAKLNPEEMFRFHKLLEQAQLLYPANVSNKMRAAVDAAFWAQRHLRRSFDIRQAGDSAKADEKLELAFAEEDKAWHLLPELLDDLIDHTRVDAWE